MSYQTSLNPLRSFSIYETEDEREFEDFKELCSWIIKNGNGAECAIAKEALQLLQSGNLFFSLNHYIQAAKPLLLNMKGQIAEGRFYYNHHREENVQKLKNVLETISEAKHLPLIPLEKSAAKKNWLDKTKTTIQSLGNFLPKSNGAKTSVNMLEKEPVVYESPLQNRVNRHSLNFNICHIDPLDTDPAMCLTEEELVKNFVATVNVASLPLRAVNFTIKEALNVFSIFNPQTAKILGWAFKELGQLATESTPGKVWSSFKERMGHNLRTQFNMPEQEVDYFLDSFSNVSFFGATLGAGFTLKSFVHNIRCVTAQVLGRNSGYSVIDGCRFFTGTDYYKAMHRFAAGTRAEGFLDYSIVKGTNSSALLFLDYIQKGTKFTTRPKKSIEPYVVSKAGLKELLLIAKESGAKRVFLQFNPDNPKFFAFLQKNLKYRGFGFVYQKRGSYFDFPVFELISPSILPQTLALNAIALGVQAIAEHIPSYTSLLERLIKEIQQCPRAQRLWDEVFSEAPFSVKLVHSSNSSFTAHTDIKKREIEISLEHFFDDEDIKSTLLFELCNLKRARWVIATVDQCCSFENARAYATAIERIEYDSLEEAHEVTEACRESRHWVGENVLPQFADFEQCLNTQIKLNHTSTYESVYEESCKKEKIEFPW